jgi:hypothetical protein
MFSKNVHAWIYGVLLTVGSVFLFIGGPDYYASRSFKHSWDIGHIVYFALLAGLLTRWRFVTQMALTRQWATILVITLLVGGSIELMQHGTTRMPDTGDVLRDLTGSLLVLVFGSLGSALKPASWRLSLQFAVLVLSLVQLWPLTKSLIDEAIARWQFPVLSDLETPFEIDRWAGSATLSVESIPSISQDKLLKLSLTTDRYSGAELRYFDGNWTSLHTFEVSLYNPDANPLQITCKIRSLKHADGHKEYEERFYRNFLLMHGWNHIEIDLDEVKESPADRSMDMSRIRGLGLFVESLPEPRVLFLGTVQLAP